MNDELQKFARSELKKGLFKCNEQENLLFKRMYSHKNIDRPIDKIVDDMPYEKLDWAMEQVKCTLKNKITA